MNPMIAVLLWICYAVSLYFSVFLLIQFLKHRYSPVKKELKTFPQVTITIPAFNEEATIIPTLESINSLEYPKEKLQVLIVNDGSTDKTEEVVRKYIADKSFMILVNKLNGGKGSALNKGLALANGTFFSCLDADSIVASDALKNMLAEFDDNVAIVTPAMRVHKPKTFLQRIQRAEYLVQVLLARLISVLDCQYVAPGPFSVYRTSVLRNLGGFDEHNLVEDQEIGYRHQAHHLRIRHCHSGTVFTNAPSSARALYNQRNRWYKGGLLCLFDYRGLLLNRKYGDFGFVQMLHNIANYALCIIALIVVADLWLAPLRDKIQNFTFVRFDILPYLEKITLRYDLFSIGVTQLSVLFAMFGISLFLFWMAHRELKENVFDHGLIVFIPYFFFYYLAKSFVVFVVMLELFIGRRQRW